MSAIGIEFTNYYYSFAINQRRPIMILLLIFILLSLLGDWQFIDIFTFMFALFAFFRLLTMIENWQTKATRAFLFQVCLVTKKNVQRADK